MLADYSSVDINGGNTHDASVKEIKFANGITASLSRIANPSTGISYDDPLHVGTFSMNFPNNYTPTGPANVNWLVENTHMTNYDSKTHYTVIFSEPVNSVVLHVANFDFLRTKFTATNLTEVLLSGGGG